MQQGDARPGYARSLGKRLQCWLLVAVNYLTDDDLAHHRLRPEEALPRGAWDALAKCYWTAFRRPTKPETLRRRFYDACRERRLAPWREWISPRLVVARHILDYASTYKHELLDFVDSWLVPGATSPADYGRLVEHYGLQTRPLPSRQLLSDKEVELMNEMLAGRLPPLTEDFVVDDRKGDLSWYAKVARQLRQLKVASAKGKDMQMRRSEAASSPLHASGRRKGRG